MRTNTRHTRPTEGSPWCLNPTGGMCSQGIFVTKVQPGGPAASVIQPGDKILQVPAMVIISCMCVCMCVCVCVCGVHACVCVWGGGRCVLWFQGHAFLLNYFHKSIAHETGRLLHAVVLRRFFLLRHRSWKLCIHTNSASSGRHWYRQPLLGCAGYTFYKMQGSCRLSPLIDRDHWFIMPS